MNDSKIKHCIDNMAELMKSLPELDAMQAYGFALGLMAKNETKRPE